MKENARIIKLFEDLFNGDPWLGVNTMSTLKEIGAEKSSVRISEGRNTIWEIVNHVTQWRLNVLERFQGEIIPSPGHNYFFPVEDKSEEAWKEALRQLEESQEKWLEYLGRVDEEELAKVYLGNSSTYYYHIHGILQHDAYHLGQIVLLSKLV